MPSDGQFRQRLAGAFQWLGDRNDPDLRANVSQWWRDPELLTDLGAALTSLHAEAAPNVVMGPQSRGSLLGALAAVALGVGFAEVRKNPSRAADSDSWWEISAGPDYQDRTLRLGLRRSLLRSGDRVLFVDDWIATGAQALACKELVDMSGASWVGAAVVVDGLERPEPRRRLNLKSLVHIRDL